MKHNGDTLAEIPMKPLQPSRSRCEKGRNRHLPVISASCLYPKASAWRSISSLQIQRHRSDDHMRRPHSLGEGYRSILPTLIVIVQQRKRPAISSHPSHTSGNNHPLADPPELVIRRTIATSPLRPLTAPAAVPKERVRPGSATQQDGAKSKPPPRDNKDKDIPVLRRS
jgi:hypothetical protein